MRSEKVLRSIRDLPPVLRGVYVGGLVFIVLAIALFAAIMLAPLIPALQFLRSSPQALAVELLSLLELGMAAMAAAIACLRRQREGTRAGHFWTSWLGLVPALVLIAALALATLGLAQMLPQTSPAYVLIRTEPILGILALIFISIWVGRLPSRA